MATDIELVNDALTEIAQDKITALDNTVNSKVIQTAIFQLPRVKRAMLRVNDWNCARRRIALNVLTDDYSLGEWAYSYRLPTDCLAVRRFVGLSEEERSQKYSVEQDQDGKPLLLTNVQNAKIVYTHNLTDVNRFDSLLYDCCATRLALQFAIAFPRDLKFLTSLWEVYQKKLEEAVGCDEAEGGIESSYEYDMVTVRNF